MAKRIRKRSYDPEKVKRRRDQIREYIAQKKVGICCIHCGGSNQVQFHHPDEDGHRLKWLSKAAMGFWSRARIDAEIARCRPLCTRCHNHEHAILRREKGFRVSKSGPQSSLRERQLLGGEFAYAHQDRA